MGAVNNPANLLDRIKRLERQVASNYKKVALTSARISYGGLTLTDDAFIRMIDDNDIEVMYFGPDNLGRQVAILRREGGAPVLYTYFAAPGQQYWALADGAQNQVIADDAASGQGLARPYLPGCTSRGRYTDWLSTQSATFEALHKITFRKTHPKLSFGVRVTCDVDATTLGELQIRVPSTGQVLGTANIIFAQELKFIGPTALTGLDHLQQFEVFVEVRKTAGGGTGLVRAEPAFYEGVQS